MHLLTRSFENIPPDASGFLRYAISTTKPQRYRAIPILWLLTPPYEAQIDYNRTRDFNRFRDKMAAALKQRASAIEDWVKAHSNEKVCLLCWENLGVCHRGMAAEAIKQAGEKAGVLVTLDVE